MKSAAVYKILNFFLNNWPSVWLDSWTIVAYRFDSWKNNNVASKLQRIHILRMNVSVEDRRLNFEQQKVADLENPSNLRTLCVSVLNSNSTWNSILQRELIGFIIWTGQFFSMISGRRTFRKFWIDKITCWYIFVK